MRIAYKDLPEDVVKKAMDEAAEGTAVGISVLLQGGHCDVGVMVYDSVARAVFEARLLAVAMGVEPGHYVEHLMRVMANAVMQFNMDCAPDVRDKAAVLAGVNTMGTMFNKYLAEEAVDFIKGTRIHDVGASNKH